MLKLFMPYPAAVGQQHTPERSPGLFGSTRQGPSCQAMGRPEGTAGPAERIPSCSPSTSSGMAVLLFLKGKTSASHPPEGRHRLRSAADSQSATPQLPDRRGVSSPKSPPGSSSAIISQRHFFYQTTTGLAPFLLPQAERPSPGSAFAPSSQPGLVPGARRPPHRQSPHRCLCPSGIPWNSSPRDAR